MQEINSESLDGIVERYNELRSSFRSYTSSGQLRKSGLNEFQHRFIDIGADLLPFKKEVNSKWLRHDDKAATARKSRIAVALSRGEVEGYNAMSLNQADKFASSTDEYNEFLEKRSFYKESLTNIDDLRNDISSYVYMIKDYIKDCRD